MDIIYQTRIREKDVQLDIVVSETEDKQYLLTVNATVQDENLRYFRKIEQVSLSKEVWNKIVEAINAK